MYGDNGDVVVPLVSCLISRAQAGGRSPAGSESLLRESQVSAAWELCSGYPSGFWKSTDILDQVFGIDAAYERSVDGWAL